ncbi:hypothetical protein [Scopulibacillus cellulosilyticus]|uniref:Lipoprotein n=1 Tax=Scopulibacillus cellulosilyticus TaxID=2665665 RepID=A0ABW2PXM2_9BACL
MKKYVSLIPITLLIFALVGCGQTEDVNGSANGGNKKKETVKEASALNENKEPETPYAPVPPSKDAKPLKDFSADSKKGKASSKDQNSNHKRKVPLGQTLMAGKKDLSNGPLKKYRLVSFYGTPISNKMGVLGESSPEEMMKKLKKQAQAYSNADPSRPAVPTIELIASVAQRDPGPKKLYISHTSKEIIERYAKLAKDNKALLILDVQLGRDSIMNEVKELEPYLKMPNVHLAIDTEFHVGKGQVPGEDLGHVNGANIQKAIKYINNLVKKDNLPDKIVMVHEFQKGIIKNKSLIKPTKHVEVVQNSDGFGRAKDKKYKYHQLVTEQTNQYGGFKLFYHEDQPLLSPKQVLRLDPSPAVVNYQ